MMIKNIFWVLFLTHFLIGEIKIVNPEDIDNEKILGTFDDKKSESFSGKLFFLNGDQLSGQLVNFDGKNITWRHPQALKNLTFDAKAIREIFFSNYQTKLLTDRKTEVRLVNGDTIFGDLIEFNELELILDTSYAGRLTISRIAIHTMSPASPLAYNLYKGPNIRDEWRTKTTTGDTKWVVNNNKLIFIQKNNNRSVGIGRTFKFSDKFEISFDYKWEGNSNLSLHVFSKDSLDYNKGSYRLNINNNSVSLYKRLGGNRPQTSLGYQSNVQALKQNKARISIKIDRKKSEFYFSVNEKFIKKFEDTFGVKVLGNNLVFVSSSSCEISNLSIDRWSGSLSNNINLENNLDKDKMVFTNNDSVSGTFKNLNNGIIAFESSFGLLPNLTLDRVSLIIFANKEIQKRKFSPNDVQLYFDDKKLTFELDKIKNGAIYGRSTSLGEVFFNLKGFKKISFKPSN